ncbi:hypothetical protein ABMA28_002958 [Loxostege sticticalis]|uniref:Uncharacterized protein n=1 Tax=Loxostege sticticalis TaxID=481309 RepID=A0ABD0T193_LOXSC
MPPNSDKVPIVECANVYKEEGGQVAKPILLENGNPSAFVSIQRQQARQAELRDGVGRPRHRYTYELDKFQKNAMLVFQYDSHPGNRVLASKVKDTFEKFRFEVEVHDNAALHEVSQICNEFFQRDFDEIGAVGIVILARGFDNGNFMDYDPNIIESYIRSYFYSFTNSEKPKIFLVQTDFLHHRARCYDVREGRVENMVEMLLRYMESPSNSRCPLHLLCDKVDELGDLISFERIASDTIHDPRIKECKKFYIILSPYLIKDLYFWRKTE